MPSSSSSPEPAPGWSVESVLADGEELVYEGRARPIAAMRSILARAETPLLPTLAAFLALLVALTFHSMEAGRLDRLAETPLPESWREWALLAVLGASILAGAAVITTALSMRYLITNHRVGLAVRVLGLAPYELVGEMSLRSAAVRVGGGDIVIKKDGRRLHLPAPDDHRALLDSLTRAGAKVARRPIAAS